MFQALKKGTINVFCFFHVRGQEIMSLRNSYLIIQSPQQKMDASNIVFGYGYDIPLSCWVFIR